MSIHERARKGLLGALRSRGLKVVDEQAFDSEVQITLSQRPGQPERWIISGSENFLISTKRTEEPGVPQTYRKPIGAHRIPPNPP